jgi:AcrR family transcriptional regulator
MRADARRNYEALVAAGRALFLEQGSDAPLDEVAKRAGVGAGTLYRHFPSRSDLLAAVYLSDIEDMVDAAERLSAEHPGDALARYMDLHLSFSMRNSGIKKAVREMLANAEPGAEALNLCKTRLTDVAGEMLTRAQEVGAARKDMDPTTFLRMIHGITLACEDNPEMAPAMLQVMKDGLLAGGHGSASAEADGVRAGAAA